MLTAKTLCTSCLIIAILLKYCHNLLVEKISINIIDSADTSFSYLITNIIYSVCLAGFAFKERNKK